MTKILTVAGKPVDHVATDVKKAHDPAETKLKAQHMEALRTELMQDVVKELMPDPKNPNPALVRDIAAVRTHFGERWAEAARTLNASSFPHKLDEDHVYKQIDGLLEDMRVHQLMQRPLHQIENLAEQGLPVLTNLVDGDLHINDQCAVVISNDGLVHVFLRGPRETLNEWCAGWLPTTGRRPVVVAANYTLGELNTLLHACRVAVTTRLTDGQMFQARAHTPRKRWYHLF